MEAPTADLTAEGATRGHFSAADATSVSASACNSPEHGDEAPAHSSHETSTLSLPSLSSSSPPPLAHNDNDDDSSTHGSHHAQDTLAVDVEENDCTPRSELPSVPEALSANLLTQMHTLDPEPSYFSPQPLRIYSSPISHSTPPSTNPSPVSSTHTSATSLTNLHHHRQPPVDGTTGFSGPSPHPDRPAFQRDISSASTASNTTVRANTADTAHTYTFAAHARQRDGPVYPNQSYAALHLQQHPLPHIPPIVRSRSSHPAHTAANSLSSLGSFGVHNDHYRDIMDSAPRTVGNSPVSSPGLFDPTTRRATNLESLNDGLHSTPWLHPAHRQPPKETHIADVQADPVSGRKIVNQYEIIDELGRGVHGKVKLGKDLAHARYVAIKIVDRYSKRRRLGKNTSHEDKIKREIAILKKARHPNIVSLLEVIDDPAKKKVYIVLEHVELGEVKWRTEGAKEICLVEWRRIKRESKGIFDNDSARLEDERIMREAHQQLAREQRRMARKAQAQLRRQESHPGQSWSLEFAMESDDEQSEAGGSSQASHYGDEHHNTRVQFSDRQDPSSRYDDSMETAFRSPAPLSSSIPTGLEGTMYGAYDNDFMRGRAASLAGSNNSSHCADMEENIPEHFQYVPLMTTQAAWEAFKDTVLGLEYLHYQNVIHRDIKPANLLVTKEHRIKISDFGVSYLGRQKTEEGTGDHSESEHQEVDEAIELAKTVGTPAFYAPELCRTEIDVDTPLIDGSIDIWALGVTLYCLIYGRVPFHDTNPFVLMKIISEEEPYIPRYRLKPVAEGPNSRPSSHGRNSQPMTSSKRAAHDLEYEEVDENLRDLLRKLLIKDARQRITIPEIKQHPWLLSGIPNRVAWAEETDPSRSYDGGKIEISKDDVDMAVVPIGFVERIRSAVKKTSDFVAKGFTRSSGSRRRAQSTVTHQNAPPNMSANSSSSTISQDGRRGSLAPIAILERIGLSREADHPLSHSVTASPEARERTKFFDSPDSRTASPAQGVDSQRPHMQDRSMSSVHTVRQGDLLYGRSASPALPPALPGTPTALDTPGGSQLSGLFGGLPRRVVNSMRSNKNLKGAKDHNRTKSIDRLYEGGDDAHGMPSLALSTTNASGHVDQPDILKDLSPVARCSSPSSSEAFSFSRMGTSSRQSSMSSLKSSRLQRNWAAANEADTGPNLGLNSEYRTDLSYGRSPFAHNSQQYDTGRRPSYPAPLRESSEDQFNRAKAEQIRLRVREARERSNSGTLPRPPSALSQSACPPSPDDEFGYQRVTEYLNHRDPSTENSPVGGEERGLAFCSSEEQFTSMSQSTSNPSIPSAASAGSSASDECAPLDYYADVLPNSSTSLDRKQFKSPSDDLAGYEGDHAVDSEEDSDSEEEVLFIGAPKKKPQLKTCRSNSVNIAEVARSNTHPSFSHRRRSARSGSNGTVKKIPPTEATSEEHTPTLETS
ncbi:similar to serine/threonine-protein kinase PAK1 [Plenodomus lingam JN3]|uniref:non-specific serine/threonine protein kinase n=1 Tax=Leptosphaeria maculans (strain JN3 / isolate v23.1.3 / race Av1-4-5-6-7-8) TaxID=985895 RepID=E5R5G8_LEPMJ|nr:similar to serine/threonine-protein kinase PAK1 [Plenodomus lingam JN3]CBX92138.1 similar to serine/threonine-protein kinase PAK1 [Plenodomus lingam JN3]